ncbi:hypothetical protein TNCT_118961 [Trichonephila clavata]|uniref:Uncharacterized protein n=1 Tax=Trichonephila clavata TaxID=2740835 RepID=A0A8X6F572_TRICU|nr:hypothetical protein TNCT_118961 [Trichonephila clavata]
MPCGHLYQICGSCLMDIGISLGEKGTIKSREGGLVRHCVDDNSSLSACIPQRKKQRRLIGGGGIGREES